VVARTRAFSIGEDGPSQMGIEDVGLAARSPNFTVVVPADEPSMFKRSRRWPISARRRTCVRAGQRAILYERGCDFQLGKAIPLRQGKDLTIIACGLMVAPALEAGRARQKGDAGARPRHAPIKPLDDAAVLAAARRRDASSSPRSIFYTAGSGSAVAMSAARQHPCRCVSSASRTPSRNRANPKSCW